MADLSQFNVGNISYDLKDKTSRDAVAPEFNNTTAYSAGDLVYKDGQLYKFDSDHAAGAWDSSEVSPTTVAAEFNQLKNTLTNVGNMRMMKLWENPDTTQAMSADTEISVNTAGYDFVMVTFLYTTAYPMYRNSVIAPRGFNVSLLSPSNDANSFVIRNLNYVSDTKYSSDQAYKNTVATDNAAIPVAIYGIKLT